MKLFIICIFLPALICKSQLRIELINETIGLSIRGLSVIDNNIFWVSGSNGTVGKSINGGKNIDWHTLKGFEKSDFRDIEAFDNNKAIIIAIGEPAYILKTIDGGSSWKIVFESHQKGMFLDAMDFLNTKYGMVVGDAVNGKIFLAQTIDGGETWQEIENKPSAVGAEGCFASSGTNIVVRKDSYHFVTGGINSRYFKNQETQKIPIIQGLESTGANSIAISKNGKNIVIVGGNFNNKNDTLNNCITSKNKGIDFINSTQSPSGYRSCVQFISRKHALSCGLSGVDISSDFGNNWLNISKESFHVLRKSRKGKTIYLAGANGRIGKLIIDKL